MHNWNVADIVIGTKIETSITSYEYQCLTCLQKRRYAAPGEGESIFCNGEDFKLDVNNWEEIDNNIQILADSFSEEEKEFLSSMEENRFVYTENYDILAEKLKDYFVYQEDTYTHLLNSLGSKIYYKWQF